LKKAKILKTTEYYSITMNDINVNKRRIRENAPHRKSLSCTDEDLQRASDLENQFNVRYPEESPFSFSKTISKALEIASRETLRNSKSNQKKSSRGSNIGSVSSKTVSNKRRNV
jgi:hypothetical protein